MTDQEMVRQAFVHFQEAMDARTRMTVRIGRRVTFIIRSSAAAFTLVACIMLFLIVVLTTKAQSIAGTIVTMNRHFDRMTQDMNIMQIKMRQMDEYMQSMPLISAEIGLMAESMVGIQQRTGRMSSNMAVIEKGVHRMGTDTLRIKQSFDKMDEQIDTLGYQMNQISRPMRSFNKIFPFVP